MANDTRNMVSAVRTDANRWTANPRNPVVSRRMENAKAYGNRVLNFLLIRLPRTAGYRSSPVCGKRPAEPFRHPVRNATDGICSSLPDGISSLIAIWMTVAPIPVVPLGSVVLSLILTIVPVPFYQVTPVSMVFAVIPVVIGVMVPVVDSNLNDGLRRRRGQNGYRRHENSGQENRSDETI